MIATKGCREHRARTGHRNTRGNQGGIQREKEEQDHEMPSL